MASNYKKQKVIKKQRRCRALISQECNVESSETPTKYLAILNAGLSTGLTEERVIAEVSRYGGVTELHMIAGKSYTFLVCDSPEIAESIFKGLHNKSPIGQDGTVIYLSYFNAIPTYSNPWKATLPNGLILLDNFLTEEEEKTLLNIVKASTDVNSNTAELRNRKVLHFGYEFRYQSNNVDANSPLIQSIPKECDFLWPRLKENKTISISWFMPDQLTVNVYEPGQGIPPHVDTHSAFLDPIVSVSLESDIVMDFRRNDDRISVLLPRRSLLIMSGESRYDWTHGIANRTMDVIPTASALTTQKRSKRISFTFRKLRAAAAGDAVCNCNYPKLCDSQRPELANNRSQASEYIIRHDLAVQLEEMNVHAVYDQIADHFSETRQKPWPQVAQFVDSFECGSVLVDVGCGNGKYLYKHPTSNLLKFGCDRSDGLLRICAAQRCNIFKCDCISLPIRTGSVDGCISIAVIHHLATTERRFAAIKEIARILAVGGRALIYVWARNQLENNKKSSYLRQNKAVNRDKITADEQRQHNNVFPIRGQQTDNASRFGLPIHTNRTEFQQQDLLVPWKLKTASTNVNTSESTFLRYYHVFEKGELESLVKQLPEVELLNSYYDQGNHCVVFRKKQ